ncbi:MAG: DUF4153 domain-containing protein [Candidatus Zixiibacteriota bacterium]
MGFLKKFPSYDYILKNAGGAFVRFPLTLLSAIVATAISIYLIDKSWGTSHVLLERLLLAASIGVPLSVALAFLAERITQDKLTRYGIQALSLIFQVIYFFTLPDTKTIHEAVMIRYLLLAIGFHFAVACVPYLFKADMNKFWRYNHALFIRFLLSSVFAAVMYIGLAIALVAADYLFGMDVKETRYFQLWTLISGVFLTWVFLAGLPEDLEFADDSFSYPRGLRIFAQYILLPLVGLYFVILIAYEAKIIVQWNWPKGWVSELVLWYAVVGLLSMLLLHPVKERQENKWIPAFFKWFFYAIVPLTAMLVLAITRRISDYGITENRYFVASMALGLSITVLYFIFSRAKDIRIIPIILCALALLGAYGPWSAFNVAKASQRGRLVDLLTEKNLLVNGKINPVGEDLPEDDRRELSSIISYLDNMHGKDCFAGILPDTMMARIDSTSGTSRAIAITRTFGFEFIGRYGIPGYEQYFSMMVRDDSLINIGGYDLLCKFDYRISNDSGFSFTVKDATYNLRLDRETTRVILSHDINREGLELIADTTLSETILSIPSEKQMALTYDDLSFDLDNEFIDCRLIIEHVSGTKSSKSVAVNSMEGFLLLKEK